MAVLHMLYEISDLRFHILPN